MIKNVVLLFFKILRTLLYKVDRATPRRFCSDCGTKCLKQNIWISIVTSKGQAIDAYRWMKDWSYLKFFFMITCKEAFRLIILIKNVFLFGNALSICFIINFDFSVGPRFVVFDQVEMTFGIDEFIRLASSFTFNTLINKFVNILKPRTFMARWKWFKHAMLADRLRHYSSWCLVCSVANTYLKWKNWANLTIIYALCINLFLSASVFTRIENGTWLKLNLSPKDLTHLRIVDQLNII